MTDDVKTRTPRWVKLLLAGSLGLNLLVAGIIGGAVLSPEGPRGAKMHDAARSIGAVPFVAALEPRDRRELFRDYRGEADRLKENRAELGLRFDALLGALGSENYDAGEVKSLLALQRGAAIERQEIGEQVLVEYLGELSAEERAAYTDRLESLIRRGPRRDSGHTSHRDRD